MANITLVGLHLERQAALTSEVMWQIGGYQNLNVLVLLLKWPFIPHYSRI